MTLAELRQLTRRVVDGQVRYYDTTDQFMMFNAEKRCEWWSEVNGILTRI